MRKPTSKNIEDIDTMVYGLSADEKQIVEGV